jgi:uncharacterized membrane protein YhaH (DUF805 family)
VNAFVRPWRHLFDFRGRASRTEYGLFHITSFGAYFVVCILPVTMIDFRGSPSAHPADPGPLAIGIMVILGLLSMGLFFAAVIGHFSVSIRRLHDQGESGIKYLLNIIPFIGFVFWLIIVFRPGDDYENDYGPDPRLGEQESVETLGSVFS